MADDRQKHETTVPTTPEHLDDDIKPSGLSIREEDDPPASPRLDDGTKSSGLAITSE